MNWFQRLWKRVRSGGFSSFATVGHQRVGVERDNRSLLRLYEQNPSLHSVAKVIARDVARAQWRVFKVRREGGRASASRKVWRDLQALGPHKRAQAVQRRIDMELLEEVEGHPAIGALTRGNEFMIGSAVRELMQLYLELNGIVYIGVTDAVGNAFGSEPAQLWPFPSHTLLSRDSEKAPFRFRFERTSKEWVFPRERVFVMRHPRPTNPYEASGSCFAQAVATEIAIDENAAMTINTRFKNRGRAEILVVGKGMSPAGVATLEASLNQAGGAMQNSGGIRVTNPPEDLHIERFDEPLGDMSLGPIRQSSGDLIRKAPGVPPEKLGWLDNSNRATIQESERFHMAGVIDPRLSMEEEVLNCHLMPMFESESAGFVLLYDSVIPDDEDFALAVMQANPSHFARNEYRELAKMEPTQDPVDDIPPSPKVDVKTIQAAMKEVVLPAAAGSISPEAALTALIHFFGIPEDIAEQLLTPPEEAETPTEPVAPPTDDGDSDDADDSDDGNDDQDDNPNQEEGLKAVV